MDYFSELLESYSKLKKRTFKLTYICEQEGGSEGELVGILSQAPMGSEFTEMPGDQYPALGRFKYRKSSAVAGSGRKMKPSNKVIVTQGGYDKVTILDDDGNLIKDDSTKSMLERLLKAMAGEEPPQTGAEAADAAAASAAEQEELAELQASHNFLKPDKQTGEPRYSTDPNDPANCNKAVRTIQETINKLVEYCDNLGEQGKKKVAWCDKAGSYLAGKGNATLTYKLVNGIGVGPDGEQTPIPAPLIADAAENHEDFLSFIFDPPVTDEDKAARCEAMNDKVGYYNNKLMFFGKNKNDDGKIQDGIAISFDKKAQTNPLYADALKKVKDTCGDSWKPENKIVQELNSKALNGIRGTVNEMALQAAVRLQRAKDPKERAAVLRDLAKYIYEKRTALIKYKQVQLYDTDDVAQDLNAFTDSEILLEQSNLAEEEGGAALVRYTLGVIKQHEEFVKQMNADDARDAAKEGGTGSRADTVLIYRGPNGKQRATAAALSQGLDPDSAVIPVPPPPATPESYELGVGQKDKAGGIEGVKQGEFNSTERRSAAVRGELGKDPKNPDADFDPKFQEWSQKLQFGNTKEEPGKTRWQNMLAFEKELESSVSTAMSMIEQDTEYTTPDGKTAIESAKEVLSRIGKAIRDAIPFYSAEYEKRAGQDYKADELTKMFYDGKTDFTDAAERAKAAEAVGRKLRVRKVMDTINDPNKSDEEKQAAKDWIIRNAIMTGGNSTDMMQSQTSYSEGRTVVMNHNEIFKQMTNDPPNQVDFIAEPPGGSTIAISITRPPKNGEPQAPLKVSLGSERAHAAGKPVTRTTLNMPKGTFLELGTEIKAEAPLASPGAQAPAESGEEEVPQEESSLHAFIRSQMQLFEEFLNSSKTDQSLF